MAISSATKNRTAANYEHSVERNNDEITFRVHSAGFGPGIAFVLIFIGAIVGFFMSFSGGGREPQFIFMIFSIGAAFGLYYLLNVLKKREHIVSVSNECVNTKGKAYERSHIGDLILENSASNMPAQTIQSQTIHYGGGSGVGGLFAAGTASLNNASSQFGSAMGAAIANDMAERGWRIKMRYGSKYITLFSNLKKPAAEALFSDFVKSFSEI